MSNYKQRTTPTSGFAEWLTRDLTLKQRDEIERGECSRETIDTIIDTLGEENAADWLGLIEPLLARNLCHA